MVDNTGGYLHRTRLRNLASGTNILGSKPISSFTEIEDGDVIQFLYRAETPGYPSTERNPSRRHLYDYAPLVYVSKVERSKNRKVLITGANIHYLPMKVDKGKVIASINILNRVPTSLYKKTVHAYRVDRLKSKIYKVLDIAIDAQMLLSFPEWKDVRRQ
jgi:hypothetical protein